MQGWLGGELHDGGHADPQVVYSWFSGHCWSSAAVVPIHMQYCINYHTCPHVTILEN